MIRNALLRSIYSLRGEDVYNTIKLYQRLEIDGSSAIENYKQNKLNEILSFINSNIHYYKNHSTCFGTDLNSYPIISKNEIRRNLHDFLPNNVSYSWRSTSGSTGSPFIFPKDRIATTHMDAVMYLFYSWHGINIGDRQARLWGSNVKFIGHISQKVKDYLLNRRRLSAFSMNDNVNSNFYHEMIRFRPKYIYAYTNALYQFALSLERQGLDGKLLHIPVAICTGEILFPFQREKIESVLGCKVVNEYGSSENGIIAFECTEKSMHVAPNLEVEILNADDDGYGDVVVTELNSKAIPFVRYRNGDIARYSEKKCKCNKPYKIIEIKEGRVQDYVKCPDGNLVHAALFAYSLKGVAIKFKVIQETINCLNIMIVPEKDMDSSHKNKIISDLREYCGSDMHINISIEQDIPPEKSGKLRYFESKLK